MFRFLWQNCAILNTSETGSKVMAMAKGKGLESMVTLLVNAWVGEAPTTAKLDVELPFYFPDYTLGYYMTTERRKTQSYGEYKAQWSITKALEMGMDLVTG